MGNAIDDISIGDAKRKIAEADELRRVMGIGAASQARPTSGRWQIGKNYFIRTVTHHLLGKLEEITEHELWMSSVSWIADDGRFSDMLAKGEALEVEPAPEGDVAIGRGSLIDAYLWTHALLRIVK